MVSKVSGSSTRSGPVLVVAGLAFEARIARACPGVAVLFGVGNALTDAESALGKQLSEMASQASGIVSFGTAGGLDPRWVPGDCLLGTHVISASSANNSTNSTNSTITELPGKREPRNGSPWPAAGSTSGLSSGSSSPALLPKQTGDDTHYHTVATDTKWLEALSRALPGAHAVRMFGAQTPVASARDKAALFSRSQAGAVDMESHHLAQLAARYGLPFAICRVVIDRADQNVPAAALAGMSADGQTHLLPVLASLVKQPSQLPALLRLGQDANRAQRALKAIGAQLPNRFGLSD